MYLSVSHLSPLVEFVLRFISTYFASMPGVIVFFSYQYDIWVKDVWYLQQPFYSSIGNQYKIDNMTFNCILRMSSHCFNLQFKDDLLQKCSRAGTFYPSGASWVQHQFLVEFVVGCFCFLYMFCIVVPCRFVLFLLAIVLSNWSSSF